MADSSLAAANVSSVFLETEFMKVGFDVDMEDIAGSTLHAHTHRERERERERETPRKDMFCRRT